MSAKVTFRKGALSCPDVQPKGDSAKALGQWQIQDGALDMKKTWGGHWQRELW